MSAPAVILIFGIACTPSCKTSAVERQLLEKEAVRVLVERGMTVKPAAEDVPRPTGPTASPDPTDEAARLEVDRIIVLDLEASERVLWVTQFVRGFPGPWLVQQVICARGDNESLECPELARVITQGLRPRRGEDVDLVAPLRYQAKLVGACILLEDSTPIEERIFGRVEMDLEVRPSGLVRVAAIAPAHVARVALGKCLRNAMETMNVGPFEGDPIKLKIPIDLD